MKRFLGLLFALVIALFPSTASAQEGDDDDVLVRIGADVAVPRGERVGSVIVVDGNAQIDGEVANLVLVIDGDAVVTGEVSGDLVVVSGDIDLQGAAMVKNVTSVRGDLTRSPESTISGDVEERDGFGFLSAAAIVFSILFWLGLTVALIVAGLIFAAIGGRQLRDAAARMTQEPVNVVVGAVIVLFVIPILAGIAAVTIIGIPLAIGLTLFLLPALWFLGYIVAGTRLGGALVGLAGRGGGEHPFAAAALGILLLQIALLIPVLGLLVALAAGLWGAGSLLAGAFKAATGRGFESPGAPAGPAPQAPEA
jgi:hypothetical protein